MGKSISLSQTGGDNNRIEFIDLAKGICILFVITLHCGIEDFQIINLCALRMPLYFTLSGLFFKDYGGYKPTILKKINKLIVPFLFFYCITFAIIYLNHFFTNTLEDMPYNQFNILYGECSCNYAIWFLQCLFWDNLLFLIIYRISSNEYIIGLLILAIAIAGYIMTINGIILPMYFTISFITLPFFYFGYLLKNTSLLVPTNKKALETVISITLFVAGYGILYLFDGPYCDFYKKDINGNYFIVIITSCMIVTAALLLCKQIKKLPLISYIGRYSIIIFGTHLLVIHYASKLLINYHHFYILFPITVIISTACIPLCRKYFPYFTAQKEFDFSRLRNFKVRLRQGN